MLPYDDNSFDVVIGSAALEHVPNDSECLKELYRIIKPGGAFIMTTLPNRLSYTEWLNRRLHRTHHLSLYGLKEAKHVLTSRFPADCIWLSPDFPKHVLHARHLRFAISEQAR